MRLTQKELRKKFKNIAQKYNVPEQTVLDIESSVWKYVRQEISKGIKGDFSTFKNIFIRYFGTFYANKSIYNAIEKRNKTMREKR